MLARAMLRSVQAFRLHRLAKSLLQCVSFKVSKSCLIELLSVGDRLDRDAVSSAANAYLHPLSSTHRRLLQATVKREETSRGDAQEDERFRLGNGGGREVPRDVRSESPQGHLARDECCRCHVCERE